MRTIRWINPNSVELAVMTSAKLIHCFTGIFSGAPSSRLHGAGQPYAYVLRTSFAGHRPLY
jgi:hypothetical protein